MTQKLLAVLFTAVLFFNYSGIVHADSQQFTVDLHYGLTNNYDVNLLQSFLREKGYYTGSTTGNYFSLTSQAVKKFQAANNLPATGYFGPLTRVLANKLVATQTANQAAQTTATITNQSTSAGGSSPAPSAPPNTTLCNGTYWSACPAGQEFICATDGIKPYCQVHPPAATATQIAGIALLCSTATSQANSAVIKLCTDGTILNGYNSNAIFRSDIDILVQQLQQKIAQQQAAAANQIYVQNWISGLNAASQVNQNFVSLQNSINAQNAALQQQQQNAQILQTVQRNQQLLEQLATPPAPTHCGIDAGVFSCNLLGAH